MGRRRDNAPRQSWPNEMLVLEKYVVELQEAQNRGENFFAGSIYPQENRPARQAALFSYNVTEPSPLEAVKRTFHQSQFAVELPNKAIMLTPIPTMPSPHPIRPPQPQVVHSPLPPKPPSNVRPIFDVEKGKPVTQEELQFVDTMLHQGCTWAQVAEHFPGKNKKEVQKRYQNCKTRLLLLQQQAAAKAAPPGSRDGSVGVEPVSLSEDASRRTGADISSASDADLDSSLDPSPDNKPLAKRMKAADSDARSRGRSRTPPLVGSQGGGGTSGGGGSAKKPAISGGGGSAKKPAISGGGGAAGGSAKKSGGGSKSKIRLIGFEESVLGAGLPATQCVNKQAVNRAGGDARITLKRPTSTTPRNFRGHLAHGVDLSSLTFYEEVEVVDPDDPSHIFTFALSTPEHGACFHIGTGNDGSPLLSWSDLFCLYMLPDGSKWAEHGYLHDQEDLAKMAAEAPRGRGASRLVPQDMGKQELVRKQGRYQSRLQNIEFDCYIFHDKLPEKLPCTAENAYYYRFCFHPETLERRIIKPRKA